MSYCINPNCKGRENPEHLENCQACGTPLLIYGQYRLLEPLRPLSSSNHTEVFEVVDEKGTWVSKPGTHKVMKVLSSKDSKLKELIEREAIVLQLMNHPGIPRCDVDGGYFSFTPNNSDELRCLVMEKIEGQTLEQWSKVHGRLPQSLVLNWLRQLVEILDAVHRAGFFHRDIKPSNIILRPNGQLVLIDFGGVREVSKTYLAKISSGLSSTGRNGFFDLTVVRTAIYAPLEQINGKAVPQSDFYALGRTFAFLATGISLINLPEDSQTTKLIWRSKAPQIERPLADFIDELMAPAPGKRPQNTQVILQYLEPRKGRLKLLLKLNSLFKSVEFRVGMAVVFGVFLVSAYKFTLLLTAKYYFDYGSKEQLAGHLENAKENYERSLKFNSSNALTHFELALSCHQLNNTSCAYFHYKEALRLQPTYWEAHYNLGNLYDEQEKYDWAEVHYRLAMQIDSNLALEAINNLARLKNKSGSYSVAADLSLQGLQKTNDNITQAALQKNLGWARLKQRRYVEAKAALEKSQKLDPTRADTYCLLAQVQEAEKNMADARISWEVCLRANSDLPEVSEWKSEVLQRLFKN